MIIKSNKFPISILLVEDNPVDVLTMQRAFKKNGIRNALHVRANGVEALEFLAEQTSDSMPKVILLDVNMPKMNGIEFLRELRKKPKYDSLLVFVLTTSREETDRMEAYQLSIAGYILKPLLFTDFVDQVKILSEFWEVLRFTD